MTRLSLVQKAFKLAEVNQIPHRFKHGQAGKDWATSFLRRHKDRISVRTATLLSIQRVLGFTKDKVHKFFDNLEKIVNEKGYGASQIFNADETGVSVISVSKLYLCIHENNMTNIPKFHLKFQRLAGNWSWGDEEQRMWP